MDIRSWYASLAQYLHDFAVIDRLHLDLYILERSLQLYDHSKTFHTNATVWSRTVLFLNVHFQLLLGLQVDKYGTAGNLVPANWNRLGRCPRSIPVLGDQYMAEVPVLLPDFPIRVTDD